MLIYVYNLLKIDPLLFFFFLKRWKMIRVQMEQGTKKTFHLDCVALIVEVDRWSDRRRRETGGRHISRTVGERRREEARCGNGPTYSPLRLKIFARVVHLKPRLACSQPTQGSTPLLFVLLELTSRSLCLSLYRPCCCCCCSTERSGLLSAART